MTQHDRTAFLRVAGGAAAGLALVRTGEAGAALSLARPKTPRQALERLMAGTARFVRGKLRAAHGIGARRAHVAPHQNPFAIVLTCADSRVPPEYVFDQSLGDIFVCRVPGNILEPQIVGSMEFAIEHYHSPLLMVLGHQRCGAIIDTIELVESRKRAPGSIQSIVRAIAPVVHATKRGSLGDAAYVDRVVRANARSVSRSLRRRSAIVRHADSAGKLRVVAARYSLDSGRVELLR